jgi:hypothetical protein
VAQLTPTSVVGLVGAVVAVVALTIAVVTLVRLGRLKRDYTLLTPQDDEPSIVSVVARKTEEVRLLRKEVERQRALLAQTRVELADAIRHVSVVRYDAFADLGGRLSFSAALLDDGGDGMVLTSIQGRSETRQYLKGVRAGGSDALLSPEEIQAIDYAQRKNPIQPSSA